MREEKEIKDKDTHTHPLTFWSTLAFVLNVTSDLS